MSRIVAALITTTARLPIEAFERVHDESALACVLDFEAVAVVAVLDVPDLQVHARRDRHEHIRGSQALAFTRYVLVQHDGHARVPRPTPG